MNFRKLLAVMPAIVAPLAVAALLFAAEPPPATQPAPATATPAGNPKLGTTETTASGLKITYVEPGAGAQDGDTVYVLYTGKLQDGTVFDSTGQRGDEPIEFVLGKGMVIKGWDEGIKGMQVGEARMLVIPPDIAYGPEGRGPIPPNATLTFDVRLIGLRRQPPAK